MYLQVGRLLARHAVLRQTGLPYHGISLDRTEKGKPFLVNCPPSCDQFDFNISHDGDYAVAAAELQYSVGVDIMQLDRPSMFVYTTYLTSLNMQLMDLCDSDNMHDLVTVVG